MQAGAMRHRVTVQRRRATQSASGEQSIVWDDVVDRWAAVEPLEGRELFAAQQVGARVPTRFRMRYMSDLAQRDRLVWDGRVYDIQSVIPVDGLKAELAIVADQIVEEAA